MQHQTKSQPPALAGFDSLPDSAAVRLPVVCALFAVSPATVWRWAAAGQIPAPKRYGSRVTAWTVGDLRAALHSTPQTGA
jgi:predicted DNA-binding transcriptional regulator AlpA